MRFSLSNPVRPTVAAIADQSRNSKRFTWFDQSDVLTCPVAYLVVLALHDNAFEQSRLNSARNIFSLTLPSRVNQITLHWRKDIVNRPILRVSSHGPRDKELSKSVASKRLKSLGEKKGLRETLT